jgi:hypothetical protein
VISRPQTLPRAALALGLRLEVDGDDLYLYGDSAPPPALVARLRRHKAELHAIVRRGGSEAGGADGTPPDWAGFARFDPDTPAADFPLKRWAQLFDDVGAFLDSGFAAQGAALGWTALDLYGCDNCRPYARIDQAGLLILLNGDKILALTADRATIETARGGRLTFRKTSDQARGRVLIWDVAP